MARTRTLALLLVVAGAACMEMRETVERTVMVRTTGSDLQPAATGYIYKKESDGPASVIKMGESEVMEQLSKIYEQPKAFAAPIPVASGPFYSKEGEGKAAPYTSETKVIPVVENQEDSEQLDGIANEDYGKMFGEYASDFGDYKPDFDEYLGSLGHFEDGVYHEHRANNDYDTKGHLEDDKEQKGFGTKHHYEKGGTGDYHSEKYESYQVSGEGKEKGYGDANAFGKHYSNGQGYKGGDRNHKSGYSDDKGIGGFHKLFNKKEYKNDNEFYDGEAIKDGLHKLSDGHAHHGSGAEGYEKGGSHESGHHEDGFGKGDVYEERSTQGHDAANFGEQGAESLQHYHGNFGLKDGQYDGKSYGYEIKH